MKYIYMCIFPVCCSIILIFSLSSNSYPAEKTLIDRKELLCETCHRNSSLKTNDSINPVLQVEIISKQKVTELPALISAITALVAVVVGPLVTLYVSRRQTLYPIKKAYADSILETTTSLLSEMNIYLHKTEKHLLSEKESAEILKDINRQYYNIKILFKDSDTDAITIKTKYDELIECLNNNSIDIADKKLCLEKDLEDIVCITRRIINNEMKIS